MNKLIKLGNYKPSGHACGYIYSIQGIAPTIMENYGSVCAISISDLNEKQQKKEIKKFVLKRNIKNKLKEVLLIKNGTKKGYLEAYNGDGVDMSYPNSKTRRGRVQKQMTQTITCNSNIGAVMNEKKRLRIRKLTPLECFRLMGFEDGDYEKVKKIGMSNSQMYKQCGNSIVVNCLEEILKNLLFKNKQKEITLLDLLSKE